MENPEKLATLCTRYRTKITKLTIQKAKKMSNTDPTKNPACTQVPANAKTFLPLIRDTPCNSS
jgi:hypothetical protein